MGDSRPTQRTLIPESRFPVSSSARSHGFALEFHSIRPNGQLIVHGLLAFVSNFRVPVPILSPTSYPKRYPVELFLSSFLSEEIPGTYILYVYLQKRVI